MVVVNYWVQSRAGRSCPIRSAGDPYDDPDAIVEAWGSVRQEWTVDPYLSDEMFWNPHFRPASQAEVEKLIGADAARSSS